MKCAATLKCTLFFGVLIFSPAKLLAEEPTTLVEPKPAPGPLGNPLKGWCPYANLEIHRPYSMVFQYASWKELEPTEGKFLFDKWEQGKWDQPRAKGKHIVFRVTIDYPGQESGLPDWLRERGIKETSYTEHGGGVAPDYNDPRMVAAMVKLIAAMGERYNNDPRVAFIQVGLLGFWGEWHCYPRNELYASPKTESFVLKAYRQAFPDKQLMVRSARESSSNLPWIGFHDDYFPDDTDGIDWKFLPTLRKHGRENNWRTAVIGGEMVPGESDKWLSDGYSTTCSMIDRAHFSWMGPYSPAHNKRASLPGDFQDRCDECVRRMGYNFRLTKFEHDRFMAPGEPFEVALEGTNRGVAPFYYPWACELALIDKHGRFVASQPTGWDIRRWRPNRPISERSTLRFPKARPGEYRLALGILDPWTGKPAIGFANELQQVEGWTILSEVEVSNP